MRFCFPSLLASDSLHPRCPSSWIGQSRSTTTLWYSRSFRFGLATPCSLFARGTFRCCGQFSARWENRCSPATFSLTALVLWQASPIQQISQKSMNCCYWLELALIAAFAILLPFYFAFIAKKCLKSFLIECRYWTGCIAGFRSSAHRLGLSSFGSLLAS